MVGKSIKASDETYNIRTRLKPDFIKISNVLKLFLKATKDTGKVKNLENTIFELQRHITVLTTTLEVLQKGFGVTEEAVSELLKPLLQKKLLERTVNAGTTGLGFLQVENVNKMSPKKIVSRYLEITKGKR